MCDKCKPHSTYWLHIADQWSEEERLEMITYLLKKRENDIEEYICQLEKQL